MSVKENFENMDYGPAPESREMAMGWLETHRKKFKHYIGGRWQSPYSKKYFDSVNPCNRDFLAKIPHGDKRDVTRAVAAAKSAYPAWSALTGHQRARYLYAIARHIQKNARRLAVL
jgi:aldehyde dehydrogenase (NAD+)